MPNLRLPHFFFLILLPCFTYFFHECAHWLAYLFYEINAQLIVNTILLPKEIRLSSIQKVLIYGSGVFFSLLQGVIGFWIVQKKETVFGFYLLLSAAIFRWTAIIQGIFSSSDELKISLAMGLHPLL